MTPHHTEQGRRGATVRRTFSRWIMDTLGNEWGGTTGPPMDHRAYRWNHEGDDYEVVAQSEDGGALWIGSAHEWSWHTSTKRFRRIALWTLYHWFITDWLGLRTRIWYWALTRECDRHRRQLRAEGRRADG